MISRVMVRRGRQVHAHGAAAVRVGGPRRVRGPHEVAHGERLVIVLADEDGSTLGRLPRQVAAVAVIGCQEALDGGDLAERGFRLVHCGDCGSLP
jgi:hypothetical protein